MMVDVFLQLSDINLVNLVFALSTKNGEVRPYPRPPELKQFSCGLSNMVLFC